MKLQSTEFKPLSSEDRIEFLDVLRGFALLGIFIANLPFFAGTAFMSEAELESLPTKNWDTIVRAVQHVFVEAKFYSLFSLLFGIGFGIQESRARSKNKSFAGFFGWRMLTLLFIGAFHIVFWIGDILVLYAFVGLTLLLFRKLPPKELIVWAGIFLAMPVLWKAIQFRLEGNDPLASPFFTIGSNLNTAFGNPGNLLDQMQQSGWIDYFQCNLAGIAYRFGDFIYTSRFSKVLAMFLVGLWIVRSGILDDWQQRRQMLWRVFVIGLFVGIPANLAVYSIGEQVDGYALSKTNIVKTGLHAIGAAPLTLAYIAGLGLLWCGPLRRCLEPLAATGRMSLSNYFLQTLIGVFVFHGVGGGIVGTWGDTYLILFALVIYSLQVCLCMVWLKTFRFGPAEWLWRSMTYRAIQPWR